MFLAVGTVLHQLFTFEASPSQRQFITTLILGTIVPVSIYHCWTNEKVVHEIVFGAMVILCGRKIRWLITEKIVNEESRTQLRKLVTLAAGTHLPSFPTPWRQGRPYHTAKIRICWADTLQIR